MSLPDLFPPLPPYRSLVADAAFHYMLMDLALDVDQALTHPAANNGGTAAVWGAEGGVGWRSLLGTAGEGR